MHQRGVGEGSVVERQIPEQRSEVQNLPPPCCVLEQDPLLPESTGNTWRKRWLHPGMTEKLLNVRDVKPQHKQISASKVSRQGYKLTNGQV